MQARLLHTSTCSVLPMLRQLQTQKMLLFVFFILLASSILPSYFLILIVSKIFEIVKLVFVRKLHCHTSPACTIFELLLSEYAIAPTTGIKIMRQERLFSRRIIFLKAADIGLSQHGVYFDLSNHNK